MLEEDHGGEIVTGGGHGHINNKSTFFSYDDGQAARFRDDKFIPFVLVINP